MKGGGPLKSASTLPWVKHRRLAMQRGKRHSHSAGADGADFKATALYSLMTFSAAAINCRASCSPCEAAERLREASNDLLVCSRSSNDKELHASSSVQSYAF